MTLIMLFEFLIGLTDVYIAGRISKEVQAAYGFATQFYFVFIVIANALTVGTVSVVSRLFAASQSDDLTEAVYSSLSAAAIAGIALALAGITLTPVLIKVVNIPRELKQFVVPLLKTYAIGLLFHYVLINCNGVLRSCNRIKYSLRTMALVCGLNIVLDLLLVFKTPLGFKGIAAATASSVFIGSLVNLTAVRKILTPVRRFSKDAVKRMVNIGWPIGLLQVFWQMASMVLYLILSALPQNRVEILAALTAGLRIESAIYLPAFAFNMANAVVVGNLLGEKKEEEAFRSGIATAAVGVAIIAAMAIAVVLNARWIVSFLSKSDLVIQESVRYLYISMISEPFMAWGIILGGGLNGAGDTRSVLKNVAFSLWLVRIPLCYFFVVVMGFGPSAVWWSMNASQVVQALLMSRRYFGKRWLTS
jgi:MATE family multidrug resistance protein